MQPLLLTFKNPTTEEQVRKICVPVWREGGEGRGWGVGGEGGGGGSKSCILLRGGAVWGLGGVGGKESTEQQDFPEDKPVELNAANWRGLLRMN